MTTPTANAKVLELAGGSHATIAQILGYKDRRNVWPWTSGGKPFPAEHCVKLEQFFERRITRQELRPDDWHLIWPELAAKATA